MKLELGGAATAINRRRQTCHRMRCWGGADMKIALHCAWPLFPALLPPGVAATADDKREGSEKPMQEERTHAKKQNKNKNKNKI